MRKTYLLRFTVSLLFVLLFFIAPGQNLIVNPSAESVPTSNGWVAAQTAGTSCFTGGNWRIQGNQNDFPAANEGSYIFFPGCGGANGSGRRYELYQNITVAANAATIDVGAYTIAFSGYTRSYNQSSPDQTEIIIEFRNAANGVIGSYTTGVAANTAGWVRYSHSQAVPVGTRTIRIRLIGISQNGDSVDSYFDNLSLIATIALPVTIVSFTAAPLASRCSVKMGNQR